MAHLVSPGISSGEPTYQYRSKRQNGQYFENMTHLTLEAVLNPLCTFMGETQSIPSLGTIPRARDAPPGVNISAQFSVNISLYLGMY